MKWGVFWFVFVTFTLIYVTGTREEDRVIDDREPAEQEMVAPPSEG